MKRIKEILANSFYQLLAVYTAIIVLIALGLFSKYALQMHIFAFIIALIGISILYEKEETTTKLSIALHYAFLIIALLLIFLIRTIPYFSSSVPLGYDTGLYRYGIIHGLENQDKWILNGGMEPGFLYLMEFFKLFLPVDFILTWLFILFIVLLGYLVYLVSKTYFDENTGIISILLYAFSLIQFKTFTYMYYKNIIGMCLILLALYFLKKDKLWLFTLTGGLLGAVHRPSFYIFGLSFLVYAFINPIGKKYDKTKLLKNILFGLLIIAIASLFYLGKFSPAITSMFKPVIRGFIQPGLSPGTFISFFTYQFASLAYLPLAILGIFILIKRKDYNMVLIWSIINLAIVYFQFFFFNRFIIMLDLVLIITSSVGFSFIISTKKKYCLIIAIILILSLGVLSYKEAINTKPDISEEQLTFISTFNQIIPLDAWVMSISSKYSPWLKGYSDHVVIAPGLFDEDNWSLSDWNEFWSGNITKARTSELLSVYNKTIFLYAGKEFNNSCFQLETNQGINYLYRSIC